MWCPPRLEPLEDRITPNTVTWVGPATGGDWATPGNWSNGTGPGPGDTASVGAGNSVTFSSGDASRIAALNADGTLNVSGGNLTVGTVGQVSWWKGEGNANDSIVGSHNNGTIHGGVTFAPGQVGQAFSFDGSTGYVDLGNDASLSISGSLTVSAWMKAQSLTHAMYLFADFDPNGFMSQGSLGIGSTGSGYHFFWDQFYTDGTPANPIWYGNTALNANQWYHVSVVRDDGAKTVQLYVNGTLDASASYAGHTVVGLQRDKILGSAGAEFSTDFFNGLIDEVQLYNRALTATEVQSAMNTGTPDGTTTVAIGGGALSGSGVANGNVINAGQVNPGGVGAAGTLTINGSYTQTAAGALNIELGGTTAGSFDQLNVSGPVALAGALNVSRINGFSPATGNGFRILPFGSRSGDFLPKNGLTLGGGLLLTPTYNPNDLTLVTGQTSNYYLPPAAGLVGWWPGEANAFDIKGGNNGTIQGGVSFAPGEVGQAVSMNGVDGFVSVPDSPSLDLGTQDFTTDLWAKFNSLVGEQVLIEKYVQGDFVTNATTAGWSLSKIGSNQIAISLGNGAGNAVAFFSNVLPLQTGTWYHFALLRSGSQFTGYFNGAPVVSGSYSGNLNTNATLK